MGTVVARVFGILIVGGFFLGLLAVLLFFIIAVIRSAIFWKGIWRFTVLAPVLMVAADGWQIWHDGKRDPSSHNLWPLEIGIVTALALGVLGLLKLANTRFSR